MNNAINTPDRFSVWRYEDEDEAKKIVYQPDTKLPNSGMFILGKEDHTAGALIRSQLLRDSSVRFAGYRVPHPLVNDVHVQVQTYSQRSHPVKVFLTAIEDLSIETDSLQKQFAAAANEYENREGI